VAGGLQGDTRGCMGREAAWFIKAAWRDIEAVGDYGAFLQRLEEFRSCK
jgi:hypothetical protein